MTPTIKRLASCGATALLAFVVGYLLASWCFWFLFGPGAETQEFYVRLAAIWCAVFGAINGFDYPQWWKS